jgi:shikimate kinase
MNLILIGPRGVGKSKVSRKLSKLSGLSVVSTDMIAVYELGGKSIPSYIEECQGDWRPFRDLEFKILNNLKNSANIILDCGGGILFDVDQSGKEIFSERKWVLLKKIGKIFALNQKISFLKEKVKDDSSRPSLSQKETYEKILQRRIPFYRSSADHFLDIDDMEIEKVAKWIWTDFRK